MSTPIRRIRSGGCARTASGHAAALPSVTMNWRRRIWIAMRPSRGVMQRRRDDITPRRAAPRDFKPAYDCGRGGSSATIS